MASAAARTLRFFLVAWLLQVHGASVATFAHSYFVPFAGVLATVFVTGLVVLNYCLMRTGGSSSDHQPAGSKP